MRGTAKAVRPGGSAARLKGMPVLKGTMSPEECIERIRFYGERSEFRRANHVWRNLRSSGLPLTLAHYNAMLEVSSRVGPPHMSVLYYGQILAAGLLPDLCSYQHLIRNCVRPRGALGFTHKWRYEMLRRDLRVPTLHYKLLIAAAGAHAMYLTALKFFYEMDEAGVERDCQSYCMGMALSEGIGDLKAADECFEVVRGMGGPEGTGYDLYIRMCHSKGLEEEAERVFDHMVDGLRLGPDHESYRIIMGYRERRLGWDGLVSWFLNEALRDPRHLTLSCYNGFLSLCMATGRYHEAISWFNRLPEHLPNTRPNVHSFTASILSCCETDNLEEGIRLLRLMEKRKPVVTPNLDILYNLMDMCERLFSLRAAASMFSALVEHKFTGIRPDARLYNSMFRIMGFAPGSCWRLALKYLAEMKKSSLGREIDPENFEILLDIAYYAKDPEMAFRLYRTMRHCGLYPSQTAYQRLLEVCVHFNLLETACMYFCDMRAAKLVPDHLTYLRMLKFRVEFRHPFEDVVETFQGMISDGFAPDLQSFSAMIKLCKEYDLCDEAFGYYDRMVSSSIIPDTECIATMISLCEKIGLYEEAMGYYSQLEKYKLECSSDIYSSMINLTEMKGHIDLAVQFFVEMQGRGFLPDVRNYKIMRIALARRVENRVLPYIDLEQSTLSFREPLLLCPPPS